MMHHCIHELEEIRRAGESVVIYGSGKLAHRILTYLETFSIPVAAVVVDKKYLSSDPFVGKHQVQALEDFLENSKKPNNFLVAFTPRGNSEALRAKLHPGAKRVLMYDFGYGIVDDINYATAYYASYANCNKESLDEVLSWLEEDYSRETLLAFLEQKQTGVYGVYDRFYTPHQYFTDDLISLSDDCVFVDCGAYNGDSIEGFLAKIQRDGLSGYRAIHAFEPMKGAFDQLVKNTQALPQCFCHCQGTWDCRTHFSFSEEARESVIAEGGKTTIEVTDLDTALGDTPVSFIKMDIEGAEAKALHGARKLIQKYKPTLTVCLYHKPEDLITIPRIVTSLNPDYKLYIRAHATVATHELVLYAL